MTLPGFGDATWKDEARSRYLKGRRLVDRAVNHAREMMEGIRMLKKAELAM